MVFFNLLKGILKLKSSLFADVLIVSESKRTHFLDTRSLPSSCPIQPQASGLREGPGPRLCHSAWGSRSRREPFQGLYSMGYLLLFYLANFGRSLGSSWLPHELSSAVVSCCTFVPSLLWAVNDAERCPLLPFLSSSVWRQGK